MCVCVHITNFGSGNRIGLETVNRKGIKNQTGKTSSLVASIYHLGLSLEGIQPVSSVGQQMLKYMF